MLRKKTTQRENSVSSIHINNELNDLSKWNNHEVSKY